MHISPSRGIPRNSGSGTRYAVSQKPSGFDSPQALISKTTTTRLLAHISNKLGKLSVTPLPMAAIGDRRARDITGPQSARS